MEVNKTVELKTTAKAIEFSANKPTSVSSEFSSNTLTVNYFEQGKKKSTEIVLESSALVSFIFNPTTNNFDLGTDEPEGDYSYIPIGYAYVSDGAITKFIPFGAVDYSSEIDEEKTARESADELLQAKKVDKETGKGLSTNDFTNDYKSKIETNEYNDIFNIRVEWDREYMPHAELIGISFQEYRNGVLVNNTFYDNVKDITNGSVYLYKGTSDQWQIAVGTPPSSYGRLPMLVGNIATKTVNGESVKLFFRNGDDETQFDELNSEKVDKKTWSTLLTATTTEDAVFQLDDTAAGVDLNSYEEIQIIFELPNNVTAFFHNYWKYNNTYSIKVLGSLSSMEMRYIVVKVKKEYGIWWIENTLGIQYDRLATHWKTVYRQGMNNLVFSSFEGMRFALSTTNVLPTGTNVRVRGLK